MTPLFAFITNRLHTSIVFANCTSANVGIVFAIFCFNTTSFTKMYWVYRVSVVEKIFRKYRRHILWKSYICLDMVWWSLHIIVFCRKLNSFKMIASENHNFIMMMHNIFLERVQFLRNDYSVVISMNAYWINKVFTDVSCYNDLIFCGMNSM